MEGFIELYHQAFSAVNVAYTVLLIVLVVYWLLVIVGLADIDAFDIDIDADFDADLDVDVDAPGHVPGLGQQTLGFLNIGEVPVMFYVSIVALSMWVGSIKINEWLGNSNIWLALVLAVPNLIVGLMVAKAVTQPFRWMNLRKDIKNEFEGRQCLVSTGEVTEKFGECEIVDGDTPIKVFARTRGGETLKKGDAATIVARLTRDKNIYVVTKYNSEDEK